MGVIWIQAARSPPQFSELQMLQYLIYCPVLSPIHPDPIPCKAFFKSPSDWVYIADKAQLFCSEQSAIAQLENIKTTASKTLQVRWGKDLDLGLLGVIAMDFKPIDWNYPLPQIPKRKLPDAFEKAKKSSKTKKVVGVQTELLM